MRDNGRYDIPHAAYPGLSDTLLSNKCWTLQSQRTRKCKKKTKKKKNTQHYIDVRGDFIGLSHGLQKGKGTGFDFEFKV